MADHYLLFSETTPPLTETEFGWFTDQLAEVGILDGRELAASEIPDGQQATWRGLRFLRDFGPDVEGADCDWAGFEYEPHDRDGQRSVWFYSEDHSELERLAHLMQKFLRTFRPAESWSLCYATTCSKPRIGEFGGGALFVTAERVKWHTLADFLGRESRAFAPTTAKHPGDHMSRRYSMEVTVRNFDPAKMEAIKAAAQELWTFEWFSTSDAELTGDGESALAGGVTEVEFAAQLARAVWQANGGFCSVTVNATYLEALPYESYEYLEEDFARLMAGEGQDGAPT